MSTDMRTPLHRVLGLGSSHEGTMHFWRQRLTALANIPLTIAFVIIVISIAGRPYGEVVDVLSSPIIAIILALMMLSIGVHMRLGMQVVIEDYVHGEAAKVGCLIANTFFTLAIGATAAFSVLKLGFGG
jgi:succinate dehydrogenase membrane anchor subunit